MPFVGSLIAAIINLKLLDFCRAQIFESEKTDPRTTVSLRVQQCCCRAKATFVRAQGTDVRLCEGVVRASMSLRKSFVRATLFRQYLYAQRNFCTRDGVS